ncbi:MAG: protein jag [Clostridia bacterium]|nr:protein jag [Clostridia bacterium]
MDNKVYVFEGKTSTEAIEKGLNELKVSKSKVDIKILESEDKRSFFSILTPRVVKVEMRLKEIGEEPKQEVKEPKAENKKVVRSENVDNTEAINSAKKFLDEFIKKLPSKELSYDITEDGNVIKVDINGEDTGYLIGYRGEVLNSIQTVLSNVASKSSKEKARVIVNIGGFREKREKDLQNLAVKIAGTVIKTKKSITLEPMSAYERKIIHTKLQENDKVKTFSIGEEPYRKVVVSLK